MTSAELIKEIKSHIPVTKSDDERVCTLIRVSGNVGLYKMGDDFYLQGWDNNVSFKLELPNTFVDDLTTVFTAYSSYLADGVRR